MKTIIKAHTQTAIPSARRVGSLAAAACAAVWLVAGAVPDAQARNGNVLPPTAQPLSWTIDDMAAAIANFSASGNDPAFYPDTPFQIIYRHPGNAFTVKPGTYFFVKLFYIDDSAPIIGDWPADKAAAADYIFGRTQLGAHDLEVEVDGKAFSLDDPGYIGGPVPTPNSPSGSAHLIQTGAFLTPLSKGVHSVVIRGVLDGDAMVAILGGPWAVEIAYTVTVE
ncbi:MAG TPA: hypothetical protein VJA21_08160 [Verrucomicrobiae bacterium]